MESKRLGDWLRERGDAGGIANLVVFSLIAATAASRASHGVLSPAGLLAVVVGASVATTATGWLVGFYAGAEAALDGSLTDIRPATHDRLAGPRAWRGALSWGTWAAMWSATGAIVVAAVLSDRSAPFLVIAVALFALSLPAALGVDLAGRAAGSAHGAALADHDVESVTLLRRAWRELAFPIGVLQFVVNAGAGWVLFHGSAAEGTLTEGSAFGDVVVLAALLASMFGLLGQRWGSVEARSGRVVVDAGLAGQARRGPVGPQALVYAGILTVVAVGLIGFAVPAVPSLLRVALLRGLVAGALCTVACGFGFVRGAVNAAADLPARTVRPPLPPQPRGTSARSNPARRRRTSGIAVAGVAVVAVAIALPGVGHPVSVGAQPLEGKGLVGEFDAFAVRVEVDVPIPAGSGSAPHVVGTARRTAGGEAANGVAAAPTHFDAVVGGKVSNPDDVPNSGDEVPLPQAECAYPGDLVDVSFVYPTDVDPDGGAPPVGSSTARCDAGPLVELHAVSATPDDAAGQIGPFVSTGAGKGDGVSKPDNGVMVATASARSSGISILDGLITVDAVDVHGDSRTDGTREGASTEASIDISGIGIAGTTFDIRAGQLVVDGNELPLDGGAADTLFEALSVLLAPSGCEIAVLSEPASYPQGFLFARPEPVLGISDDGTTAGSMSGGLIIQCDLPVDLTAPTGFSPARLQVVLGFVYTSVSATDDIGFDFAAAGGGTSEGGGGGGLATDAAPLAAPTPGAIAPATPAPAGAGPDDAVAEIAAPVEAGPVDAIARRVELFAANFAADRPWIWLPALLAWFLFALRGLERVRREIVMAVL